MCALFPGISPLQVLWELEHDPDQWMVQIAEVRAYEQARSAVKDVKDPETLPKSPMVDLAIEFLFKRGVPGYQQRLKEAEERKAARVNGA